MRPIRDLLFAERSPLHNGVGAWRRYHIIVAMLTRAHLSAILAHDKAGRFDVEPLAGDKLHVRSIDRAVRARALARLDPVSTDAGQFSSNTKSLVCGAKMLPR
jgi:hypothetical protein